MIEPSYHFAMLDRAKNTFDALSYEWGPPDSPREDIKLQDQIISIGENLWYALHCLRDQTSLIDLWIDGLCINQEDPLEKSHQVGMMGEIYKAASFVRVWLGGWVLTREDMQKEDYETVWAFAQLGRMRDSDRFGIQQPQKTNEAALNEERSSPITPYTLLEAEDAADSVQISAKVVPNWNKFIKWLPTTSRGVWKTMDYLLNRSYWSRIWIVQEYILGREVVIHRGFCSIKGTTFNNALGLLANFNLQHPLISYSLALEYYIPRINNSPGAKISARRHEGRNQTLAELLEACRFSKATLPQDKIYAILGLATDVPVGWIPLDYGKSLWRVKVDVGRFFTCAKYFPPETRSRMCFLLDEIFPDCEEQNF
jgi:hypothetical protein